MATTQVTMRLDEGKVEFLRRCAAADGVTLTELVGRLIDEALAAREVALLEAEPDGWNQTMIDPAETWAAILGDDDNWDDLLTPAERQARGSAA